MAAKRSCEANEIERQIESYGLYKTDTNHLRWNREHKEYPRNWSTARKSYDIAVIVAFETYTTIISTTGPSAAELARADYGVSRVAALVAFTFMYGLGQAIGGVFLPPCSEFFGRRRPYLYSCAAYSIASLIVGIVPSLAGVFVGRIISGFASAVPSVVLAGSIEDLFDSRARIWMILLWNSTTTLGLTLGPIYGSYIGQAIGWRWIYYTSAIVTTVLFLMLFGVRESRLTKLLAIKQAKLEAGGCKELKAPDHPDAVSDTRSFARLVLWRPVRISLTEPIVIMVTLMIALVWGLVYLFTEALTVVYSQYGWSRTTSTLPFLAIACGIPFSIIPRLWDLRLIDRRTAVGQLSTPEDKIFGFVIAAPALALGLWLFSWTVPPYVHTYWLASTIGLVLVGFAANETAYTLNGYLANAYTIYASSGLAGLAFLRGIVAGSLPLFAYPMFTGLGPNVAGSIIAALATLACVTPIVFTRYGRNLRERSQFAKYSAEVNEMHGDE